MDSLHNLPSGCRYVLPDGKNYVGYPSGTTAYNIRIGFIRWSISNSVQVVPSIFAPALSVSEVRIFESLDLVKVCQSHVVQSMLKSRSTTFEWCHSTKDVIINHRHFLQLLFTSWYNSCERNKQTGNQTWHRHSVRETGKPLPIGEITDLPNNLAIADQSGHTKWYKSDYLECC